MDTTYKESDADKKLRKWFVNDMSRAGASDLLMYVPDSLFAGSQYGADPFVYLYAETGGQGGAMSDHAGDEAWAYFAAAPRQSHCQRQCGCLEVGWVDC